MAITTVLAGCANWNTIDRTTELGVKLDRDGETLESSGAAGLGRAIHLDVQQRLAIVNSFGSYCTEPSPDALATYAASLGVAAGVDFTGAGSLSGAQSSNAASIGLRTQSITLMRDALYRMCEAYSNGQMSETQVATFLARSQDLTAVILAVEQLTGPVVALQAQLINTASARATAAANSVSKAIELSQAEVARLESEVSDAEAKEEKIKADIANITAEIGRKETLRDNPDTPDNQRDALQREIDLLGSQKTSLTSSQTAVTKRIERLQGLLDEERTALQELRDNQDSILTNTSASTDGSGQLSGANNGATVDVSKTAEAVKDIVAQVLDKDYVIEGCMAIVSGQSPEITPAEEVLRDNCFRLFAANVEEKLEAVNKRVAKRTRQASIDDQSSCVSDWLNQSSGNLSKAKKWVNANRGIASSVTDILFVESVRTKFIRDEPTLSCG